MKKVVVAALAVSALFWLSCKKGEGGTAPSAQKQTVAEKAKVEFFIMSQCPFGVQVMDGITPVLEKMGGDIDFVVNFIGNAQGDQLSSMHGEKEVQGDIIELCLQKHASFASFVKAVSCMNKNWRQIPEGWDKCASEAGAPLNQVKACVDGQEGKDLLRASFQLASSRGARGSPTMFIGGKPYNGGRDEKAFARAICDAFPKDKPQYCATLPPPVKFPAMILSDTRCKNCNAEMISRQLQSLFPGAEVKIVDYASEEGKKLYAEYKLTKLPVMFFGKDVEKADNYMRIQRGLEPMGDWLVQRQWGRFDPTKEVCDNNIDDTGNGKVDCDDPDCKYAAACRKEEKNKLEVFVMSQCPYGVRALDSMKEVLDAFKKDIKFEIHYIADEEGDGFRALHGQPEVDENIRELCAIKYYNKNYKFMDYIWCRNKNIRSDDWKACTGKETGIDAAVIEKCFNGEGKNLLREDIKIAQGLDVGGSPTWYANNVNRFSGLDANSIKENFCRYNQGKAGCEKQLSGPEQAKVAPGSCGK